MRTCIRMLPALALSALFAAEADAQTVQWVYANGWARNHVQIGVVADEWIKKVEEAAKGRIRIRHVSDGALLKPEAVLDGLHKNVAKCGAVQPAFTPGLLPIASTLAGIMDVELGNKVDAEGVTRITYRLFEEFEEFSKEFGAVGLRPLVWTPTTPYAIISRKPTRSLKDVAGQKIRAFGTTLPKFQRAMGAIPVTMAFGEMYTSLQTGVIDAALTDTPSMVVTQLFEVAKYVLTTGPRLGTALAGTTIIHVCREDALAQLSAEDRDMVLRISRAMNPRGAEIMNAATQNAIETLKARGVTFNHLSPAETAELAKATPFFDEAAKALDKQGLPGTRLFARYRELAQEYLDGRLKD